MRDVNETQEQAGDSRQQPLSQEGKNRLSQGYETESKSENPDKPYQDKEGRNLTLRTHKNGDSYMVRVYDSEKTPELPEQARIGDAGRANLKLERDQEGQVTRARLQDIETLPGYEKSGTGSMMLNECENISRQNGASEIYGSAPEKTETREWYKHRGYGYRDEGKTVYKDL